MISKKILGKVRKIRDFRLNFGANRNRDWRILTVFFIVLNILNIGWGLYNFWRVYTGRAFETEDILAVSSAETLNEEILDGTLELFNQKKIRLFEVGGKKYYSDPAV